MSTRTMLYFNGFCNSQLHIFLEFDTDLYSPEYKCAVQWSALEVCGVHTIVGPEVQQASKITGRTRWGVCRKYDNLLGQTERTWSSQEVHAPVYI